MFNAGMATTKLRIESQVDSIDSLGAPTQTWILIAEVFASVNDEEVSVEESLTTGPRRESAKRVTFSFRMIPKVQFGTRMRLTNPATSEVFSVNAIRYDRKRTVVFVDAIGGVSNGN